MNQIGNLLHHRYDKTFLCFNWKAISNSKLFQGEALYSKMVWSVLSIPNAVQPLKSKPFKPSICIALIALNSKMHGLPREDRNIWRDLLYSSAIYAERTSIRHHSEWQETCSLRLVIMYCLEVTFKKYNHILIIFIVFSRSTFGV